MQIEGGGFVLGPDRVLRKRGTKSEIEILSGVCVASLYYPAQILRRSDPDTKLRVFLEDARNYLRKNQSLR